MSLRRNKPSRLAIAPRSHCGTARTHGRVEAETALRQDLNRRTPMGGHMKLHLLAILVSATALAVSHGAAAQGTGSTGAAAGDWEFGIGPVFVQSKDIDFKGGATAHLDSTTGHGWPSPQHPQTSAMSGCAPHGFHAARQNR